MSDKPVQSPKVTPEPNTSKSTTPTTVSPLIQKTTRNRIPAMDIVEGFLRKTNIVLYTDPLLKGVKTISDGSLILEKPAIFAKYLDE